MLRHGLARNVAPGLNFLSDVFRNIVCPVLQSVEGNDANRIIELPGHKIANDGFELRALDLGLAIHGAILKAVDHEIDRLIRAVRYGTVLGDQPVLGIANSNATGTRKVIKPTPAGSFLPLERLAGPNRSIGLMVGSLG